MQNQLYTFRIQALCSAAVMAIAALAGMSSLYGNDWAFTTVMPGGHRGPVNALIYKGDFLLSAGDDGFLEIWNTRDNVNLRAGGYAQERFQISQHRITAMAGRPEKDEVCAVENDGMGLCRVSAWNYKERRNIFSLQFRDSIAHIFYSTGGNFIIAAGTGRTGLVFINADTGAMLQSPASLTETVSLAVTGRSERNMLAYSPSGVLSYWDLESGNETNHFNVPPNLYSPALFSNNRYLAGVNAEGLTVIHAVTGDVLAKESSIPDGSLLYPSGDDFFCLIQKEKTAAQLYRYTIDRNGRLAALGNISPGNGRFTAIAAGMAAGTAANAVSIALGTGAGSLVLAGMNGQARTLAVKAQTGITEAAVSESTIAFLAENGTMGFIPLDYSRFPAGKNIPIEQNKDAYNRITAFAAEENDSGEQFIFWQDENTRTQPVIRSSGANSKKLTLSDITFRSPVRSMVSFGGKILFLDSTGNLSVVSPPSAGKSRTFTFFSVGLMDAAFIDRNRIIIGRSAISGNTPFLMINVNTGETVPLPYPSQAGVTIYRGASGSIYAVAVSPQSGGAGRENNPSAGEIGVKTSILYLDPANITASISLVDFQGEDTQFSIAESPGGIAGSLAATIGGEGAAIYSGGGIQPLERTAGLPLKLFDGGQRLISLDGDGSICWYENNSGKLLAVFRLHPDGWTLQTEQRTVSGGL
ncbi:MAG: WD40 repeat domain-containing protein [Treponema sp.]|jgi:WD40 repeat protein|nr:WD40 repeat domain-containing protein [Treponema sp.]